MRAAPPRPAPECRIAELPWRRTGFAEPLSLADDATFLSMLWSANAVQTGRGAEGRGFFRALPVGAETNGIIGPHAIYPWELETLANELLITPKNAHYCTFDCHSWSAMADVVNRLRALERAEYGAARAAGDIFRELGRIGARQFDWQRGFFTAPEFYRGVFIYGQGECAAYFEQSLGISIADLTFVGFALMSVFLPNPVIRPTEDLALLNEFGLDPQTLSRALGRIALPLAEVRQEAELLRADGEAVAYRPSILRRYPCILTGLRLRQMVAPLPMLIANRVSSGLFYDVIGGGGPVRAEVGPRFETYTYDLLTRFGSSANGPIKRRPGGSTRPTS
jgi:hypothetical protein